MPRSRVMLLAALLCAASCAHAPAPLPPSTGEQRAAGRALLEQSIDAHGGLARWKNTHAVRFLLASAPPLSDDPVEIIVAPHALRWLVRITRNPSLTRGAGDRGGVIDWFFDEQRVAHLVDGECAGNRASTDTTTAFLLANKAQLTTRLPFSLLGGDVIALPARERPGEPPAPRLRVIGRRPPGFDPERYAAVANRFHTELELDPRTHRIARVRTLSEGWLRWEIYADLDGLRLPMRVDRVDAAGQPARARAALVLGRLRGGTSSSSDLVIDRVELVPPVTAAELLAPPERCARAPFPSPPGIEIPPPVEPTRP